ncbi:hypothetical protein [Sphingomonas sp.]|uniref:hypothetical protein n=1 Tax=Sphingomonas sp. TaxID=28214 RepID=UPI00286DB40B|nr:hypothetical protein [Sphingomonas sp.]
MSEQSTRENSRRTVADDLRQRAIDAYDGARDGVSNAGRKAGDTLSEAPLLALAGGLAAGALIAALLPRSKGETELLRPAGKKLADTARTAVDAAREAGTSRLGELGLTRDAGVETLRSVLKGAGDAARTSADAALTKVRGSR